MAKSEFVYMTFIRTTVEKLWRALIEPELPAILVHARQDPNGRWVPRGKSSSPTAAWLTAVKFLNLNQSQPRAQVAQRNVSGVARGGLLRMTYELEPVGDLVEPTLTHQIDKSESKFIEKISGGWPMILSSLKALLETGESFQATRSSPKGM